MVLAKVARAFHAVVPFSQLRTARLIHRAAANHRLIEHRKLYGFAIELPLYRDVVHAMLYLLGERFVDDAIFLEPVLRPGMVVADVGANIGYVTLYFSRRVGPSGHVYVFEPFADNMREIERAVKTNGISNCSLCPIALGAAEEIMPMAPGLNAHFDATGYFRKQNSAVKARVERLDYYVRQNAVQKLDLIKIDVEGFELNVLKGAQQVIEEMRPILFVEVHPVADYQQGDPIGVVKFLRQYYQNIVVYRPPGNDLKRWRLWSARLAGREALRRACTLPASAVESNPGLRYQLLCLPDRGA